MQELLKLHKMVCNAHKHMEEPSLATRNQWDGETISYVEELEYILLSLNEQAIEALWQMEFGGRG